MIIVISGEDTFRSREFLHATIEQFKKKRDPDGLNIHRFDAESDTLAELKRQEGSGGLFGGKRLFVVERILKSKASQQEIEEFISKRNTEEGNVVCFFIEGLLGDTGVAHALTHASYQYPFPRLKGVEFSRWVQERFRSYQADIDSRAQEMFLSFCGNDLWAVDAEIAKLSAFACGRQITSSDLELLSAVSPEVSSFQLLDALFALDRRSIAKGVMNVPGDEYLPVLSLIAGQFRSLGWMKEYARSNSSVNGAAQAMGLHPFVVKKLTGLYSRLTFLEIEAGLGRIRSADGILKRLPVNGSALFAAAIAGLR